MERAREQGHARSIGVSNFNAGQLQELRKAAAIPPAVNQLQLSPFEYRRKLVEACRDNDVAVEAYSPLGDGPAPLPKDRTPGSPAYRPHPRPGTAALVPPARTGCHPEVHPRDRIEENAQIFDFVLSSQDMADLDVCDKTAVPTAPWSARGGERVAGRGRRRRNWLSKLEKEIR